MKILYYILEAASTYLAIVGTWEIAQSTVARGYISSVLRNKEAEKGYNPLSALNPLCLLSMIKWWFCWEAGDHGVEDLVILKKRFSWGLRFLMLSIILIYALGKVKFIFISS